MVFKNNISVVYFTYKRAILLDAAIKSLEKNCKSLIKYPIHVIYHYDKEHNQSYQKLARKFGNKVVFYKRQKLSFYFVLKNLITSPINILWILRYPKMILNFNNFKFILERILKLKNSEFIMLNTDDTIFYKKLDIKKSVFLKILNKKKFFFFRSNFGLGLKGYYKAQKKSYKFLFDNNKDYIFWNSKNSRLNSHMAYHFQIEGAIYHKKTLLNFLRRIIYHNPITLEAIGFREAKLRDYFSNTIAKTIRTCLSFEINSVQKDNKLRFDDRLQIDPKYLSNLYLRGFNFFKLVTKKTQLNSRLIPSKIFLKKGKKEIQLKKS